MLSPGETLIVNMGVLLIFGMVFMASYLYLPDHIAKVTRRATFYFFGSSESPGIMSHAAGASQISEGLAETLRAKAEL